MASNFRISTHRNSESLHLKLIGDFDGSSAWQLLRLIKKSSGGSQRVFIHTSCLERIYPFGRNTFHQILDELKGEKTFLFFTGENANQIAPKKYSHLHSSF